MRVPSLRNSCGLFLSFLFVGAGAAFAADEIEVSAVHFRVARPASGGNGWLEADVVLNAVPAAGRLLSRVRVELTLGFELPAAAGVSRRVDYYRSAAECVALEAGHADVRFYLPPELVKRDQLHAEPKFWTVSLAVAGAALSPGRASASAALATDDARRNFLAAAALAAPAGDGLLQPQYLTPFALEYPRATPSFVRRDPPALAMPVPSPSRPNR